jgi:hypothetical protein
MGSGGEERVLWITDGHFIRQEQKGGGKQLWSKPQTMGQPNTCLHVNAPRARYVDRAIAIITSQMN